MADQNYKIKALNDASLKLKEAMKTISTICKGDSDIEYHVWKTNRSISCMEMCICKKLESELNKG